MNSEVVQNSFALRILQAKRDVGKHCPYCPGEYAFTKGRQEDTLIATCHKCGGRKKERTDRKGNKLPPADVAVVVHF